MAVTFPDISAETVTPLDSLQGTHGGKRGLPGLGAGLRRGDRLGRGDGLLSLIDHGLYLEGLIPASRPARRRSPRRARIIFFFMYSWLLKWM